MQFLFHTIGKSPNGARSDIVVSQFAIFVTAIRAKRLQFDDAQAIASSDQGLPMDNPLFAQSKEIVKPGESIQEALDKCARTGGTVILTAGTHECTTNITLKSRVRLRGEGRNNTTLNLANGANIGSGKVVPTLVNLRFPGPLAAGQSFFDIDNNLTNDAILIVVAKKELGQLYRLPGDPVDSPQLHRGEFIPVALRTPNRITTEGGLSFDYPSNDQEIIQGFEPTIADAELTDLTIVGDLRTGNNIGIVHLEGTRRVFLRRVTVTEKENYGRKPSKLTNMINGYGCVDLVLEDCEWKNYSTFGSYDQTGGYHPYGAQFFGGVNNVIMRGYGHSTCWGALDVGSDNFDQEWNGSNNSYHVAISWMEIVDTKATTGWYHGPFGGHTCFGCRWIGTECMNGGGWGAEGWRHEYAYGRAHFPTVTGYPPPSTPSKPYPANWAPSKCGNCYGVGLTFEGKPHRWWDCRDKGSLYVDIKQPGTTNTGAGPGVHSGSKYVNCDGPLPRKI